jgi:hypothetical protein
MTITLSKINADYNASLKNLTDNTNRQMATTYRMLGPAKMFFANKIQAEYKQNLNNLITKRKNLIREMGKLISSALIVGINYIGTNYQLYGCINDANNMREFVSARGCDKILMMTDRELVKPTKINIIAGLTNLLLNTKDGETALFYYSGHGTNIADVGGDETDGQDECLFTLDGKVIIDDELNLIIKKNLRANSSLVVLCDCCHSGTMIDLKYNYHEDTNNTKDVDLAGKVYYISGCRDSQVSMESFVNNQSQGALTAAFMSSIGEQSNWKDFMTTLRSKLPGQTPQLSTSKQIDMNAEKCIF